MTNHARPWRILLQTKRESISFGTHAREETPYLVHKQIDADFDELVVGTWCHIEQMNGSNYWMQVGNACFNIHLTKDGPIVTLTEGVVDERTGRITGGRA